MNPVLLIDYGSTYTKIVAVDVDQPRLLGCASAYTTVETDVKAGLNNALAELERQTGKLEYHKRLACSSAAGGLKMVASGLVPELTAKAASLAAMGAGAKITGLYSYELTEDDITEIVAKKPDIMLLTGGTDGGNKKCIIQNAKMLAEASVEFPVIVSGNRNAVSEVKRILTNRRAYFCDNVMPAVDKLNIEPARQMIRDIFLDRIIHAKGLDNEVLMPTPAAVLAAAEMLAEDMGDLIVIDVGGATTDVYSVADGTPRSAGTVYRGLPEPKVKRTVEGDIGMRYSAQGIIEAAGVSRIAELANLPEKIVLSQVENLNGQTKTLPETADQKALDFALAAMAIKTATIRHTGSLEEVYTTSGKVNVQTGKDLTDVSTIIMTGGALVYSDKPDDLVKYSLYNDNQPQSLRPKNVNLFIDKQYILAPMGLLSSLAPVAAKEIIKSNFYSCTR